MAKGLRSPVVPTFAKDPWSVACEVLAHAEDRWGSDGWEVIAECWSLLDIVLVVHREGLSDRDAAIGHFAELACEGARPECRSWQPRPRVRVLEAK